jgi:DNA-binding beta-propeller fold protein YncE
MEAEVRIMRALLLAVCAVVVVTACGRAPLGPVTAGGGYKLYAMASTRDSELVSVIDSRSHSVERTLPSGTPSPDWTHIYSVKSNSLLDVDPQTGAMRHTLQLPGGFQLPPATLSGVPGGLSQDGRWLVLEAFDKMASGVTTGTHFLIVDTSYAKPVKRVDLAGSFQFDAISNDGQRIYLIEYLSNGAYHVRFFNVVSGQLDPTIVFDKSDGSSAMAGLRLSGVASPDGHWLYSVYTRQNKGAFIHALSLDDPIAFCIDLPGSGYSSNPDEFHWSLALSRDGRNLYAANGAMGIVAEGDTASNAPPSITRTVHIDTTAPSASLGQDVEAKEVGANGAVLSPDGRTLVMTGATGVMWVDTANLRANGRQLTDWTVWSLALSPNGNTLYAVNDAGMIAEVSMTGPHAATRFGGGLVQPIALIRVEAAQVP